MDATYGDAAVDADLVETLVRRAVCCPCAHPARIGISYGPGVTGKDQAELVHGRVRASRPDIFVRLNPGSGTPPDDSGRHYCVTFDVSRGKVS